MEPSGLGEKELKVWLKICNESEKNIGQKLKKFWDIKKSYIFLHYCLHDSIQNPSPRPSTSCANLIFRSYFPEPSPVFSVLVHTGGFFPATWYTFMSECPWCLSPSAPTSSASQNATLSLWGLCNSLSHPHSPHPTSRRSRLYSSSSSVSSYHVDLCQGSKCRASFKVSSQNLVT